MPERRSLLILGGTGEAAALAAALAGEPSIRVITSLAGRTRNRAPLPGELRIGGFGGPAGLARYLRDHRIEALIDATHPYAQQISENAVQAAAAAQVPLLRLARPAWSEQPGDRWLHAADTPAAARFDGIWFLVRLVEAPRHPLPLASHEMLLARGPFDTADELAFLEERRIEAIVTKNSGGKATYGKLAAARQLALTVIMIARPPAPICTTVACATVESVEEAIVWAKKVLA
jgi:precorrin-6A/cobalt-precorrin-6A reductase